MHRKAITEEETQLLVVNYLNNYKSLRFIANYLSGAKLPIYLARKAKRLGQASTGCPDLLVFHHNGKYCGLALELKKEGTVVFKKDGSLRSDEHLQRQFDYLQYLNGQGWYASFAIGANQAIEIIRNYINGKL